MSRNCRKRKLIAVGFSGPHPAPVSRVDYLIVKNALLYPADFSFWERGVPAQRFREAFAPQEMEMEYRVPQFEKLIREHGATIAQAAERKLAIPELNQFAMVVRAQAYRRHLNTEFDRVKGVLIL
jgi:hypothetical protein